MRRVLIWLSVAIITLACLGIATLYMLQGLAEASTT